MINNTIKAAKLISVPKIIDPEGRGNLSVIEKNIVPFKIKRVYYLYDVPSGAYRGGHAHKQIFEYLVPLSGSFDVILKDGDSKEKITLNKPNEGLLIAPGIWRELENFTSGAVCLVLASEEFDEADYVRDYKTYLALRSSF
ncbi:FdtA/QdtA family cupin domain-containing protein [Aurantibacter sp.]|uniref:sugar 3,4-ketoisomerase n=1 Tax=Aurantibacter sp. TaxID=2807103 RepID=UPI0035C7E957